MIHDRCLMPTERVKHGDIEMKRKALAITLASILMAGASTVIACEYKVGESKFTDYANCRYGEDNVQVVKLSEESKWKTAFILCRHLHHQNCWQLQKNRMVRKRSALMIAQR